MESSSQHLEQVCFLVHTQAVSSGGVLTEKPVKLSEAFHKGLNTIHESSFARSYHPAS